MHNSCCCPILHELRDVIVDEIHQEIRFCPSQQRRERFLLLVADALGARGCELPSSCHVLLESTGSAGYKGPVRRLVLGGASRCSSVVFPSNLTHRGTDPWERQGKGPWTSAGYKGPVRRLVLAGASRCWSVLREQFDA